MILGQRKLPFKGSTSKIIYQPRSNDINGYCFDFAEQICNKIPGAKYLEQTVNGIPHGFIKYKGKYYDAESPDGEEDKKQ